MGSYEYANMNLGLCRILIPIINGNISKGWLYSPANSNNQF
jgi:hypothetical protein